MPTVSSDRPPSHSDCSIVSFSSSIDHRLHYSLSLSPRFLDSHAEVVLAWKRILHSILIIAPKENCNKVKGPHMKKRMIMLHKLKQTTKHLHASAAKSPLSDDATTPWQGDADQLNEGEQDAGSRCKAAGYKASGYRAVGYRASRCRAVSRLRG